MNRPFQIGAGLLLAALLCLMSPAQVQWQVLGPVSPGGSGMAACYDSLRDRVVVYRAYQTWEYDGTSWTPRFPAQNPTQSIDNAMAYDPIRQRCVLFGDSLPETWTWDGSNWTLASTDGPPGRINHEMTWNDARGTVMLFGGGMLLPSRFQPFNDLWEWNGSSWVQIQATSPPPISDGVSYSTVAYDAVRQILVVFGAVQSGAPGLPGVIALPVTWEWAPQNGWQNVVAGGPSVFRRLQVFDEARGRMVVFGSNNAVQPIQSWEREASGSWFLRTTPTLPTNSLLLGPVVYDSRRNRILLFHFGSVYAYSPTVPARHDPHGSGCPGSLGGPTLTTAAPWSLPWLGEILTVSIGNLPTSAAFITMGFSDTAFGPFPLPLDLGFLGMPTCFLRAAPEALVLVQGTGNSAAYSIPVPTHGAMRGFTFFQQAMAIDPAANPFGATLSNSVRGVIGSK